MKVLDTIINALIGVPCYLALEIVCFIIIIFQPQAWKLKDKNKVSMVATALHSVTMVFWNETALLLLLLLL